MPLTTPTLATERLRLRPFRDDDGDGEVSDSWVYGLLRREWETDTKLVSTSA